MTTAEFSQLSYRWCYHGQHYVEVRRQSVWQLDEEIVRLQTMDMPLWRESLVFG